MEILRGGDLADAPRRRAQARGGLFALGARFATAARGRWLAAVATIAVCAGVVTLMLALASLLERLREDPGTVGKRYQLAVALDPARSPTRARLPGVDAVGQRYSVDAADSFRLGEPVRLVAYPGDHTSFEAPPLAEGRRIRGPGEVEVGLGLADALGLRPGLDARGAAPRAAARCASASAAIVRALENDGRIAWVQPGPPARRATPTSSPQVVVRLDAGRRPRGGRRARSSALGAPLAAVGARADRQRRVPRRARRGAARRRARRRPRLPVRAGPGADRDRARAPRRGRAAARRAAPTRATVGARAGRRRGRGRDPGGARGRRARGGRSSARSSPASPRASPSLPLAPTPGQVALVAGGLLALAAVATALVARRVLREPVVAGLREE